MEVVTEQTDTELVADWWGEVEPRYSNDVQRGGTIGVSRALVGQWRRSLDDRQPISISQKNRLSIAKYLARMRGAVNNTDAALALRLIAEIVRLARERPEQLQVWAETMLETSERVG